MPVLILNAYAMCGNVIVLALLAQNKVNLCTRTM